MVNKLTALAIGAIGVAVASATMSIVNFIQDAKTRKSLKKGIEKVEEMSDNQMRTS